MQKYAFITRHAPTEGQIRLAAEKGIELIPLGDMDAFRISPSRVKALGHFDGVIVVHPASALMLAADYDIGVFENANRAPEGERPSFEAIRLHIYTRDESVEMVECGVRGSFK